MRRDVCFVLKSRRGQTHGLSKQLCARLREPDEGPALVHDQPAALDRQIQAGLVFGRRSVVATQERPVDPLDIDPAILDDFRSLACSRRRRAAFSGSA